MVILKRIKSVVVVVISVLIAACASDKCLSIRNQFSIANWNEPLPKQGILYRYKKDSNFSLLEQKSEIDFRARKYQPFPNISPSLIVNFIEYKDFPTNSDYKLVLDNHVEYKISNILLGDYTHGCQLPGGVVNQCELLFDNEFNFSSKCGVPVK